MTTYREVDGHITREYALAEGEIFRKQTDKALVEIVPTKEFGLAFFIDNELQLAEKDEYIYHEMLVHPCLATSKKRDHICIIGGGDGCAVREVLKWPDVVSVNVIDWDKEVTDLFTEKYSFLNKNSLQDYRVRVENSNIQERIHDEMVYDCILIDLVDPNPLKENFSDLWYDTLFLAKHWIQSTGSVVINLGGLLPWKAEAIDSFVQHVTSRFSWNRYLHKVFVPSFGREWCFLLLTNNRVERLQNLPPDLQYCSQNAWVASRLWSKDYQSVMDLNLLYEHSLEDE